MPGVWLDRGELDKIIERNAQETSPRPATPPQQPQPGYPQQGYPQQGYGYSHKKRRKSFLEELFD
jgi:Zn-finger nucleic acid-binding protein